MQRDHVPTTQLEPQAKLAQQEQELHSLRERIKQLEAAAAQRDDELRLTEERYRTIILAAPLVLAAFDMNGIFTLSEGKGLEKLGLKPGQVVGQSVFDVYKDFPEIINAVRRCLSGESVDMVAMVGPLAFQSSYRPTAVGELQTGGLIVATEISDLIATQEKLREATQKFEVAIQGAELGLWDWNMVTNEVQYSDRWVTMLGYVPGELEPNFNTFGSLIHPEDGPRAIELVNKHVAGETQQYEVEFRMKTKTGNWKWILASGKLMERTADGKPKRMVGIHQDIDDRKRSAEKLRETNKRFEIAMEGAQLGMWEWNLLTNETDYSERWASMLGYSVEEVKKVGFSSLVSQEDVARMGDVVGDFLKSGNSSYQAEFRVKTKEGKWKWIRTSGMLMDYAADGKPVRLIGIHEDIDARKKAELDRERLIRQLREASRYKDEFFAVMSHELRTPLNAMIGLLGIVLMKNKLTPDDANLVTRARANSDRLLTLINNILDISRMEAGRLQLTPTDINIKKLTDKLQANVSVLAEQKRLQLAIEIDPLMPESVIGDEDALTKIITNLLGNGIKFTEQGSVTVHVAPHQDKDFSIQVKDTGIGIPAHMHEIIFESFRQVDASSTRAFGGSGLGLSIVRNLCQAMGGTVRLESEPGKGSTFTAILPLQLEKSK